MAAPADGGPAERNPPSNCIGSLRGNFLRGGGGQVKSEELLKHQLIAIFFSASWCPPCKQFMPILAEGYKKIRDEHGELAFEVIFVTHDRHERDWKAYHD